MQAGRVPTGVNKRAVGQAAVVTQDLNVLGGELVECGADPLTGFYRDGCCRTGPEDVGSHTVCAVVSAEFLAHQQLVGNDLSTPRPEYGFPGLRAGDRWCVCASRWRQAYEVGVAPAVLLAGTHERAIETVSYTHLTLPTTPYV